MFYLESVPLGLPLVLCQSMEHGHTTEAVTTDTFLRKSAMS